MKIVFNWLVTHRIVLIVAAVAATVFLLNYLTNPQRPFVVAPQGYYGHTDVKQHYIQALELRDTGSMKTYMYGPLYGLLGSLFFAIYPIDIFFIPNLILFIGTMVGFFLVLKRLFTTDIALFTTLAMTVTVTIHKLFVFPWATSVTACCTVWMLYCMLLLYTETKAVKRFWLWVSAAGIAASAYYARFSIEFIVACIPIAVYLVYLATSPKKLKQAFMEGVLFIGVTTVFLVPLLYDHYLRFGHPFKTQYSFILNEDGIPYQSLGIMKPAQTFKSLGEVLFGIGYVDEQYRPVMYESPILLLELIASAITLFFIRRFSVVQRLGLISVVGIILVNLLFYGMYPAFRGETVKFGCVHYIRVSLILFGIFLASSGWLYFTNGRRLTSPATAK